MQHLASESLLYTSEYTLLQELPKALIVLLFICHTSWVINQVSEHIGAISGLLLVFY
jgi:hypothetical protein